MSLRIAVCTGQIPFARGGAEILADALVDQLRAAGHTVEMVRLPFRWYPKEEILKGYLAWRLINLDESEGQKVDMVIPLKFPAYVVPHRRKVTWLIQQFRQVYDLYGTEHGHFDPSSAVDAELRQAIWQIDTRTLHESKRIFTISGNVSRRLRQFNGLLSEPLYPPPALDGHFYHDHYGDYILSISRLNKLKRVDYLIRAMGRVKTPVRCRIAGQGEELHLLERLARQVGAADRIDFLGFVDDRAALDLYAKALAVYYAPLDEDYGFVTVEAMKSRKPVITADDSGAVLEFVEDGVTGLVTPTGDVDALAQCLDRLYLDRKAAEQMGAAGQQKVSKINWGTTITTLLEA
jgi:glycosyltransferase involved in cell wall biosynthesis